MSLSFETKIPTGAGRDCVQIDQNRLQLLQSQLLQRAATAAVSVLNNRVWFVSCDWKLELC